jgi:hypothetical protein
MKRIIILLLIFFFQHSFCQEYEFDTSIQYREKSHILKSECLFTIFFNSKNTNFYFITKTWNQEVNCYLVDNSLNVMHEYKIQDIKKNDEIEYWSSKKIDPNNCNVDCALFELNEATNSSGNNVITGSFYINKKRKKKSNFMIEIECKPYKIEILNQLIKILDHHFYFCYDLKTPQNYLPISIKNYNKNNCLVDINLVKSANVDFKFAVNQDKLNFSN